MARCDIEGCGWRGKAAGLPIHKAKQHGIHPQHEDMSDTGESWTIKATFRTVSGDEPLRYEVDIPLLPSHTLKPQKPQQIDPLDALVQELEEEYGR